MSERELKRAAVLLRVAQAGWSLVQAAGRMGVSYRQAKRLWKRYRGQGARGLVHGNTGRASNRAKPKSLRRRVVGLLRKKYGGEVGKRFGPTLAAEHLAEEDGIELGVETLRGWMLAEGLWSRDRRRRAHRQRRERKGHFGELVQLDGSFHAWLEGRGPGGCLMNMVDDATGTTLCRLGKEETIWAAVGVLKDWIGCYGVPQALYTDWKNVYVREPNAGERMRGEEPVTQFGRMCQALGIEIWAASSPQAKGRVERNHGTHQDRLVKKLRRKGMGTHADANRYLVEEYCRQHNARYAQAPGAPENYHLPSPGASKLAKIFRLETERTLSNDWVVQHDQRCYQVQRQRQYHAPARGKVRVCEGEDGSLEIYYREQKLKWKEISAPPKKAPEGKAITAKTTRRAATKPPWKPGPDHPWRKGYTERKPEEGQSVTAPSSWASASAAP
jgi:molybdenum-dependent DNA-binding transcriptional regulator ModE